MKDDVKVSCGVSQFLEATTTFQEVVEGIVGDPQPLSLLQKRRGEKGSRELQGDLLRQALEEVIALLVSVPFLVYRYVYMHILYRYAPEISLWPCICKCNYFLHPYYPDSFFNLG